MFNWAYNTIKGVGAEMGGIVGIKGGQGWMREQFGVQGLGGAMKPFGQAFGEGGGLMGMARYGKRFFGIGFDKGMGLPGMGDYLRTISGGERAMSLASFGRHRTAGLVVDPSAAARRAARGGLRELGGIAREAPGIFRRRRIAGAIGGAIGLAGVSSTIGLENAATLGIGVGLGMAGGRYFARAGARDLSTWGRRGGKLGFAAAGVGLMAGLW